MTDAQSDHKEPEALEAAAGEGGGAGVVERPGTGSPSRDHAEMEEWRT
ncbi:hypothetical protein [Micrococcus lacusdianchii]|nr:hypothetical protein [Micrococcus sp. JXJ CY 30]